MESLNYANLEYVQSYRLQDLKIFNIQRKKQLAYILQSDFNFLKAVKNHSNQFYQFTTSQTLKNGVSKSRELEVPNKLLKCVHKRIGQLLSEIPAPEYLFSKKKSSCVLNAKAHAGCRGLTLNIDIRKFFPSTSKFQVEQFFGYFLQYPRDIAQFMASICTVNDHIPTGSSLSLVLTYWTNKPMFDEMYKISKARNIKMTVYVDDISFTGTKVNDNFKRKIEAIITKHGHRLSLDKIKFFGTQRKYINRILIINGQLKPNSEISRDIRILKKDPNSGAGVRLGKQNYVKYIEKVNQL